jgi:rod shape-determining protein MreB
MRVPSTMDSPSRPAGGTPRVVRPPTAVAVDLGSGSAGIWAAHRGTLTGPSGDAGTRTAPLVRRGSVVDGPGCVALLTRMIGQYPDPIPAGPVVVGTVPVLATAAQKAALRKVLDTVFAPSRLLLIDSVRATAIGSGAAAGVLVIADIGAEVTEVGVLDNGRLVASRRSDLGTRDIALGAEARLLVDIVAGHVEELRADPAVPDLTAAARRGILLAGEGALDPDLTSCLSARLHLRVHRAVVPRTVGLYGAGLAATSVTRHPAAGAPARPDRKNDSSTGAAR